MSNLLEAKNLSKFYKEGNEEIKAVNNINFSIKENEKVVIYGRSGSGKSTLLNLLSGLDTYSDGEISYKNYNYDNQHKRLTQLRKESMGFVYQFHHLLKEFTSIGEKISQLYNYKITYCLSNKYKSFLENSLKNSI